jgi:hypothetical protein
VKFVLALEGKLREARRYRVIENKVMRKFGPKEVRNESNRRVKKIT